MFVCKSEPHPTADSFSVVRRHPQTWKQQLSKRPQSVAAIYRQDHSCLNNVIAGGMSRDSQQSTSFNGQQYDCPTLIHRTIMNNQTET
jgi:hypothetical protein